MTRHDTWSSPGSLPTVVRYGIAVLSVAIAAAFVVLFAFIAQIGVGLTPFLLAVGAVVWYAGIGPGIVAIVLSVLTLDYFFIPPLYSLEPFGRADLTYLGIFTAFALVVGWVAAARRKAEDELRRARDRLDATILERTAELRRSETYLAEAQRLSHTGSWAWNIAARKITHCSQEFLHLYGFDPQTRILPYQALLERVHPDDRGPLLEDVERAIRDKTDHEMVIRAVLPDGTTKHVHGIGHPVLNESGDVVEFVGAAMDVTEHRQADEERRIHVAFLESMDRINRAMQGTNDIEQMMSDVLDTVLSIFDCDRAWLVYPCDPDAPAWRARMEHTRPDFPGAFTLGADFPMDADAAEVFRAVRESTNPVRFGLGSAHPVPENLAKQFDIQSLMGMAVYPKIDKPYMLGLHQCSYPRAWTAQELELFREIGRRMADALTGLLMFRNLANSEARLEEAQSIAHVGYWERDIGTNRITCSDETRRIFGLALDESPLTFPGFRQMLHPDDLSRMLSAVSAAIDGGPRYDIEYRIVRPGGETRIIHSQGDITKTESGAARSIFGIIQDITERKQAETALRESEQRYRSIFQSTGVSIWDEDFSEVRMALDALRSQGVSDLRQYFAAHPEFVEQALSMVKITDVNDVTIRLFEVEGKDELLRTSLHKIFVPETYGVFAEKLMTIAEGRTSFEAETVLRTVTGKRIDALVTMTLPPPPARLDSVLVTIMDITERKRAEYLTGQVFETSPDSIAIVGRDYRFQRVNPVHERLWGIPAERMVGMHLGELLGWAMFEQRSKAHLDRCFAGEEVSYAEWFTTPHGPRYRATSVSPLRPGSQRTEAALIIARDLTDYMQASEALHEARTELAHVNRVTTMGQLAASIAHEVNQPINATVTNASAALRWLDGETPDLDEARQALNDIIKDGNRAGDVIGQIRALIKKVPPQHGYLNINDAILDVTALTRSELLRKGVTLQTALAEALPPIRGDRVQLQQVILNLIINAVEAMSDVREASRRLLITTTDIGASGIQVDVQDSGPGLTPESIARLFDPFYTTKAGGMGMGLSICRSIIEAHGGQVWASPNNPRGAIFHLTLPAVRDATA